MQVTFNTMRKYTAEGQVITAKYEADKQRILFMDHSRMIAGEIDRQDVAPFGRLELIGMVMEHYDYRLYDISVDAMSLERGEVLRCPR